MKKILFYNPRDNNLRVLDVHWAELMMFAGYEIVGIFD